MQRYLLISGGGHILLVAGWFMGGVLISKPRMSYYAIDLVNSMPAGGTVAGPGATAVTEAPAPKTPPPPAPTVQERKLPASEVIKVQGKPKKSQPAVKPSSPPKKQGLNLKAALAVLDGQSKGGPGGRAGIPGGSGSGITAEAGTSFPFPWYLKAISDRLNQQWKPPREFQSDTLCQIGFVIARDGQVSNIVLEKPSGDATFDQLAQRAVLYSNPLPPLPAGFPDDTLRVHMKFLGKPF